MHTNTAGHPEYGDVSLSRADALSAMEQGGGVLRLAPAWVPRAFGVPGRRLGLHPDDYFAYGGERGGIVERWLASATRAQNGPLTGAYEGVSMVIGPDGRVLPFSNVIQQLASAIIGKRLWDAHGAWPAFSKFFDNADPLPFHVHHDDAHAHRVGQLGKPEAYYFPPEMNGHLGTMPVSYLGLRPGTSRDELRDRLRAFGSRGDNRITELSVGYRIELGTGWDIPAGTLHAPGSVLTYEPQAASDVLAMCESWASSRVVPEELMWKDVPVEERGNVDYVMELVAWDVNTDPLFARNRFMRPLSASSSEEFRDDWVVYRSDAFSAKRLTVAPGKAVTVHDAAAYGAISVRGRGRFGPWPLETSTMVRFGEVTNDEFFVSEEAALRGVRITNESPTDDLVVLRQFGPGNPERPPIDQLS